MSLNFYQLIENKLLLLRLTESRALGAWLTPGALRFLLSARLTAAPYELSCTFVL